MHTPLISVVIVTYNAAPYLERAINSVLEQTYENIELIVIDGNSTDGTVDVIRNYEDRLSRWISEPDPGIYDAMNKGVNLTKGDWVYFLGADDNLENCLHIVARHLKNRRIVYYGDVYLPHRNKVYAGKFQWHTLVSKNINHQSIFYARDVFSHYQFNPKYKMLADYDLNIRCWGEGRFRFKYIPILIATHNDGGISHQRTDEAFLMDKPAIVSNYFGRRIAFRNGWMRIRSKAGSLIRAITGINR